MFARIATFEGGDLEEIRRVNNQMLVDGSANLPEGISRVMALEGDRRLIVTFFDSREALDASEQRFEEMGDEIPESVRGRRVALDKYEVVFDMETVPH